ncbi:hypothetical protein N7499_001458 [Penicillium canescens]|uniref:Uncharacterized protein n=1 Tax=Penicillium canescens TaxID=5083 RepID=A0AAD6I5Q9_PENCN|nr:uncharacterized protein N7446_008997 [Penicillium canescens]KAJ5981535.1 hypothetical protein N7522_013956 [Penicillium canescens]KAJ6034249.1 hypothetical protein N7460_008424 [Penicillium canescens]KAJ6045912.1 hypothetical protein N7444_007166 [Penicillium canescens]KAJ6052985.1 hypothetical protein N7446_008997 [Penicillium canescens]KAJ6097084.1 hypothetical protein N7499_001458 [Penicillium canescens]
MIAPVPLENDLPLGRVAGNCARASPSQDRIEVCEDFYLVLRGTCSFRAISSTAGKVTEVVQDIRFAEARHITLIGLDRGLRERSCLCVGAEVDRTVTRSKGCEVAV